MSEDTLLPGFTPSENDMIEMALAQPLEVKIKKSIALLQCYERGALELSDDGYYLAFSGGKDSCVIKQLAFEAGVKFKPWYNLTTIDPPELVRFIKRVHADVAWSRNAKGSLPNRAADPEFQTMPQRRFRWCCLEYKEHGGDGMVKVIGVRISESARRRGLWREIKQHSSGKGCFVAPIVYWTDDDVWAFIRSRDLPYCSLYDEGFKRLGCIGCPMAGQAQREQQFIRWPKYEAMWKRAAFKLYAWALKNPMTQRNELRSVLKHYDSPEALWDWWRSGKAAEGEADCVYEEMMLDV